MTSSHSTLCLLIIWSFMYIYRPIIDIPPSASLRVRSVVLVQHYRGTLHCEKTGTWRAGGGVREFLEKMLEIETFDKPSLVLHACVPKVPRQNDCWLRRMAMFAYSHPISDTGWHDLPCALLYHRLLLLYFSYADVYNRGLNW